MLKNRRRIFAKASIIGVMALGFMTCVGCGVNMKNMQEDIDGLYKEVLSVNNHFYASDRQEKIEMLDKMLASGEISQRRYDKELEEYGQENNEDVFNRVATYQQIEDMKRLEHYAQLSIHGCVLGAGISVIGGALLSAQNEFQDVYEK